MSRLQAHLPDPTTPGGDTATLGSTDDLLSKLAGEEIDKLLADAEVERPPETVETPIASKQKIGDSPAAVDNELSTQIDQLLEDRRAPAAPVAPPAPPVDAAEEARLKKLAEELEVDGPKAAAVTEELPEEKDDVEEEDEGTFELDKRSPALWLRPLEWMNRPLDDAPDWVRPAMGKLAILTMLNALAVIGYVIFRQHH